MIIGNFGLCIADNGKQGGFSYIWITYKAYICNDFELQLYPQLLSGLSGLGILWHLHGRGGKVHISKSALAAF